METFRVILLSGMITYFGGLVVKGEFSGIGFDSVPIENGTFELQVTK